MRIVANSTAGPDNRITHATIQPNEVIKKGFPNLLKYLANDSFLPPPGLPMREAATLLCCGRYILVTGTCAGAAAGFPLSCTLQKQRQKRFSYGKINRTVERHQGRLLLSWSSSTAKRVFVY